MKNNYQRGTIYEASGTFYVQYSTMVGGVKKRVSHKLCNRDAEHNSTTCPAVLALRDEHMVTTRRPTPQPTTETPITEYWEQAYLPDVTKNLKPSTVAGYQQIWDQFLEDHFTGRTFQQYEPHHGNKLLREVVEQGYGRRTVAHVRSLASGIFTHGINEGILKLNPWTEVRTPKTKAPGKTKIYSLTELMDIVNNKLKDRTDAQLMVCLAGLMGLRPSEIVALCWEDANLVAGKLRVHQAYVRGNLGTTKTDVDETLPLFQPVLGFFKSWHMQSGEPRKGFVFPNTHGDPINIRDYVVLVLRPAIGEGWKSMYAFRRSAASILTDLTGSPIAASQLLRHINLNVAVQHYIKANRAALSEGIQMLESRLSLN
jgi:integrase